MTIASAVAKSGPYNGNGSQTVFAYTFKVFAASELQVVLRSAGGIETIQTLTTHYTVSSVGNDGGGNVTMVTAPLTGETLTIVRNVPFVQLTDLRNQGGFYPEVHERVFDKLTQQTQQLNDSINRALQIAVSTPAGVETTLPSPVPEKLIGWNSAGTGLQNFDSSVLATLVAYSTGRADLFDGDGVKTQFTLTSNPGNQSVLDVSIGGVTQRAGIDFVWTGGTTLTFVTPPPVGTDNILARYFQGLPGIITEAQDVTFTPDGAGAGPRTAQNKMRDAVSVKDFGAAGDGVTNDSAAFAAAAAFSNYVTVPKGTYRLNTDVTAPNVVFEFQDATLIGDGKLKSANIINYGAGSNYASNQSAFFQSNGHVKSLADVAVTNLGEYPRKYFPAAAYIELLRLSPGVTKFENQSGATLEAMNETYFREMLREMADNGIRSVIVPYVSYIGFWFYKPSFSYPYDYDTARTGKFWGDWLTSYPNVQSFDAIRVTLDECAKLGVQVYLGLTRNGDSPLMNDLYLVNVLANPDPLRFGLTLAARLTNAINETRQIAADLVSQYGHVPSFAGFYISHEPDHIGAANNYLTPATGTAGTNPALRSYGKPIMLAPSSPLDLAATSTFANAVVATGCDIIMPQDSIGPGYNFSTNVYTYVPSVPLGQVASHFATWKTVSDIANAKQTLTNRSLRFWATAEVWQMGLVQNTTLTLSAVSGASVTATAGVASFVAGDVGKWISTADGGNAQITAFTSTTVVTVSTTAAGGRAFGSTSQSANNWSLNSQYANDYPAAFSRLQSQLLEEWPYIEAVALYAWFGFLDSGTLSLRLSQGNSGLADYRTRAVTLYNNYRAWQQGQRAKYQAAPNVGIVQQQFFERGSATAATSLTDDFATFYPRHDGSRVTYICTIRGYLASGTSTLTIGLRVNGVLVKSTQDLIISNHAGGTYSFMYSELPKGLTRTVGISFSSTSANFTLLGAEILAMEMV